MVDSAAAAEKLLRIVLSWDYWEVNSKLESKGGMIENLRAVPPTFSSLQVRGSGQGHESEWAGGAPAALGGAA